MQKRFTKSVIARRNLERSRELRSKVGPPGGIRIVGSPGPALVGAGAANQRRSPEMGESPGGRNV